MVDQPDERAGGRESGLRQRAESEVVRAGNPLAEGSPEDHPRVVHELRVHQIELEMQNEELRRAQAQLIDSRERFQDLYQNAPVGYLSVDADGRITLANLKMASLLGVAPGGLVGTLMTIHIGREHQDAYYLMSRRLLETRKPQRCQLELVRADATRLWAVLDCGCEQGDGQPLEIRIVTADVSERIRADEARLLEQGKMSAILDVLPVGVAALDSSGMALWINPALETMRGLSLEQVQRGDHLKRTYLHKDGTPMPAEEFASAIVTRDRRPATNVVTGVVMEDGTTQWASVSAVPVDLGDWRVVIAFADLTELAHAETQLLDSNAHLERLVAEVVTTMGRVVEVRDPYTQGHQQRVAALAVLIASEMGLSAFDIKAVEMAALVHDIGKLSIPADILNKPGQLSAPEFSLIKQHPTTGFEILQGIEFPWPVAESVFQHHERMDGSGYPRGLVGEELLPAARILALADVIEAMASHRPYRAALGIEAAVAEVRDHAAQYDPEVLAACLALHERGLLESKLQAVPERGLVEEH
jgi:PAS domain S-box-containing protein/putative nucleotidyltransferase with HDIG domain